mmetsp:Transcript_11636/g.21763  ORF Transcript_11636/g.21763 Transcript_11636/m.21763 type:complete len:91 (+) Transcript_11636:958-1230(+)
MVKKKICSLEDLNKQITNDTSGQNMDWQCNEFILSSHLVLSNKDIKKLPNHVPPVRDEISDTERLDAETLSVKISGSKHSTPISYYGNNI